jgi:dihydropteroate synthase
MDRSSVHCMSPHDWIVAGAKVVSCHERPLIMGIVNITTDSFYDGGRYAGHEQAVAHALELIEQGADLLDLGAESTRPGAHPVSEEDEMARLIPVVTELARRTTVPISIDTTKSKVARSALDAGASIINDVSALQQDREMAEVVARSGAGLVLMHRQGTPRTMQEAPTYGDVVAEVARFLAERMQAAEEAGIAKSHIVLDPGIGFGKLLIHNVSLLDQLSTLARLNRPLLIGLSRKAFIGHLTDRPVDQREWGTAAAVALAVDRGAQILRVHDVGMMKDVVKVAAAVRSHRASSRQEHDA